MSQVTGQLGSVLNSALIHNNNAYNNAARKMSNIVVPTKTFTEDAVTLEISADGIKALDLYLKTLATSEADTTGTRLSDSANSPKESISNILKNVLENFVLLNILSNDQIEKLKSTLSKYKGKKKRKRDYIDLYEIDELTLDEVIDNLVNFNIISKEQASAFSVLIDESEDNKSHSVIIDKLSEQDVLTKKESEIVKSVFDEAMKYIHDSQLSMDENEVIKNVLSDLVKLNALTQQQQYIIELIFLLNRV